MSGIAMVDARCDYCGSNIRVRKADRERGWGRFCDKACKAKHAANGPARPTKPAKKPGGSKPAPTEKERKIQELTELARAQVNKPKRESIKDTPKPEGYGDFS